MLMTMTIMMSSSMSGMMPPLMTCMMSFISWFMIAEVSCLIEEALLLVDMPLPGHLESLVTGVLCLRLAVLLHHIHALTPAHCPTLGLSSSLKKE